jgi:hypothetical protein
MVASASFQVKHVDCEEQIEIDGSIDVGVLYSRQRKIALTTIQWKSM